MQYIHKISISNFKYFIDETINIKENSNALIYGENGSGKSSLYFALRYGVYKEFLDIEEYSNINISDTPSVLIEPEIVSHKNYYFLNHLKLQKVMENNDLFSNIENIFSLDFYYLFKYTLDKCSEIDDLIQEDNDNDTAIQTLKSDINEELGNILESIKAEANVIIEKFEESFQIDFEIEDLLINTGNRGIESFSKPIIKIIDSQNSTLNLNNYLNEAKTKTISLAIYFAMIKLNSNDATPEDFKLLVLDDFLLSFDMGNRSFIMKYIFDEFSEYQKIILTHNLLFYNLVNKIVLSRDEDSEWQEMKLFPRLNQDGTSEAKIYENNIQYLDKADKELKKPNPDLEIVGNNLRKSLEKVLCEITIFLEIGSIQLNDVLKNIKRNNNYTIDGQSIDIENLNKILRDSQFYKDIALNSSSHSNDYDLYKNELVAAMTNIKEVARIFKDVKNGNL
jgi:hypothetical protein